VELVKAARGLLSVVVTTTLRQAVDCQETNSFGYQE
jgi:hypothetical protein